MFTKETINDVDLAGQTVLLRADYNVPVENGAITSDFRLTRSVPTIQALLAGGIEKLIICSHLGRPEGPQDTQYSLSPVAQRLGQMLGQDVKFVQDCVGEQATQAAAELGQGEILLLENLRFHPEEKGNDDGFARQLAGLAGPKGLFVQDGFGVAHRADASTVSVPRYLPSVAGLLLEQEVDTITQAMQQPERPLMAIVGGAKIDDKIDVLNRFIEIADLVILGGAMANTFLAAQGVDVAASLYDQDKLAAARAILAKAEAEAGKRDFIFAIPHDGVVAEATDGSSPGRVVGFASQTIGNLNGYPESAPSEAGELRAGEKILDIGPAFAQFISGAIGKVHTLIWNGPMGMTEVPPFDEGTEQVIQAVRKAHDGLFTVVGGGDSAVLFEKEKLLDDPDHLYVSTGGGASLELMSGHPLPALDVLPDKK